MGSEDVHGHRAPSLLPPAIRTPLRQPPGTAIYVNLTRVQLIRSGDSPPRGFHVRVHLSPFHVLPPSHVSSKRWHFQKTQCRCRWLATGNAWPEPGTRLAGWYSLAYHLCVRRFYTSSNYFLIESICGDLCSTEYAEVCASMYRETVRFVQGNNVAHKCVLN